MSAGLTASLSLPPLLAFSSYSPPRSRPLRTCHTTHLEHMKRLKLDIPTLVPQKVHHRLEVRLVRDEPSHDGVVGPVEEDLAEELEGLTLGHIVGGEDEGLIHFEELPD